jgi:citronellol/citronellal dehydrogenase
MSGEASPPPAGGDRSSSSFGRSAEELRTMPIAFRHDFLKDKVALVSGGASGIGKAVAFFYARLGARLVICGRDEERLAVAAAELEGIGAEVLALQTNIRDVDQVNALFDAAWARFGGLDILVNNAGGQFPQAAIDFTPKGWNAVIDTNLNGSWHMMQAAARRWRYAERGGSIVNIVTVVWRGMPGLAHTCAARAGVIYLSKTLAIEWAPLGIRVNCLAPGIIATEGMDVYSEEARRDMPNSNPMKRFGQPEDIANAACYLAGESGSFITGEVLVVDGGNQVWGDQWAIERPGWFDPAA